MPFVATDLDGTLLRSDESISPRTTEVIDRICSEGGLVALVTGRPLRWMGHVFEQLRTPPPTVCANGAVVYDPHTATVLRTTPLPPEVLVEVCRRIRTELPGVSFAVEISNGRRMRHEPSYQLWRDASRKAVRAVSAPAELFAAPAVKLLAHGTGDVDSFAARTAACVAGMAEVTHSSCHAIVEISAPGVTKATGLAWLCEQRGVSPADVVAFGDMPNDVPMLAWAGRAVAVANAHPAVLEVADEVTSSNDEDGVAACLERLLTTSTAAACGQ